MPNSPEDISTILNLDDPPLEFLQRDSPSPSPSISPWLSSPSAHSTPASSSAFVFPSLVPNARAPWQVIVEIGFDIWCFFACPRRWKRWRTWLLARWHGVVEVWETFSTWVIEQWDRWVRWWNDPPYNEARAADEAFEENAERLRMLTGGDLEEVRHLMERGEYPFSNLRGGR